MLSASLSKTFLFLSLQEELWPGEVRPPQPAGEHEGQGAAQDAGAVHEDEPEPDRPRAEAAVCPAGQAALHEDRQRAQDIRQSSVYGHPPGKLSMVTLLVSCLWSPSW